MISVPTLTDKYFKWIKDKANGLRIKRFTQTLICYNNSGGSDGREGKVLQGLQYRHSDTRAQTRGRNLREAGDRFPHRLLQQAAEGTPGQKSAEKGGGFFLDGFGGFSRKIPHHL